jgi:ABC-type proline/glycine betaine transport system substrate-binding protein
MGRFYNCIIGWQCELINNDKMATYGLDEHFTNFRPGTSAALASSLIGAYEKGEPWLGYYWSPTWVLGAYDMVVIKEPAYSDECWVDGDRGCAFPTSVLHVAVSKDFSEIASEEIIDFLDAYAITLRQLSPYLKMMSEEVDTADAARRFLEAETDVWTAWVSDEVAGRVQAALN